MTKIENIVWQSPDTGLPELEGKDRIKVLIVGKQSSDQVVEGYWTRLGFQIGYGSTVFAKNTDVLWWCYAPVGPDQFEKQLQSESFGIPSRSHFTERARRVLIISKDKASSFKSTYVETDHLLLALFQVDTALGKQLLGTEFERIMAEIRKEIEELYSGSYSGTKPSYNPLFSHQCKKILVYADEERKHRNQDHIGTTEIFLGLCRVQPSCATDMLYEKVLPNSTLTTLTNEVLKAFFLTKDISI